MHKTTYTEASGQYRVIHKTSLLCGEWEVRQSTKSGHIWANREGGVFGQFK